MSNIIKDIKKYNMETAQRWKIESRKLLLKYKNDKSGFEKILHFIVGTSGGGILREDLYAIDSELWAQGSVQNIN